MPLVHRQYVWCPDGFDGRTWDGIPDGKFERLWQGVDTFVVAPMALQMRDIYRPGDVLELVEVKAVRPSPLKGQDHRRQGRRLELEIVVVDEHVIDGSSAALLTVRVNGRAEARCEAGR